jgi:hypothetical protein
MSAYLEALKAVDIGIFIAGEDFAGTQTMDEEYRQEIRYMGAFGTDGPVIRSIRHADEDSCSFSAVLLKSGVARGMANESIMKPLRDFDVLIRRGALRVTHRMCNWTRIAINSTEEQVTLTSDISIPGYVRTA